MSSSHVYYDSCELPLPINSVRDCLTSGTLQLITGDVVSSAPERLQEGASWVEKRIGSHGLFLRPQAEATCVELTCDSIGICVDDGANRICFRYALAPSPSSSAAATRVTQTVEAFQRLGGELRPSDKLARMLRKQDTRLRRLQELVAAGGAGAAPPSPMARRPAGLQPPAFAQPGLLAA